MSTIRPVSTEETPAAQNLVPPVAPPAPGPAVQPHIDRVPAPGPAPRNKYDPRGRVPLSRQGPSTLGISSMLQMTSALPWSTDEDLTPITFIPNFCALSQYVHAADELMRTTYRFTRSNPQWIPLISQLYFSMMFYLRILECMREAGTLDAEFTSMYLMFHQLYDYDRFMIPGFLVPHFQSLSVTGCPFFQLGDISPTLPSSTLQAGTNHYLINQFNRWLPNILLIFDFIHRVLSSDADVPLDRVFQVRNVHGTAVAANNTDEFANLFHSPTFKSAQSITAEERTAFRNRAALLRLPTRITVPHDEDDATDTLTWNQSLRFEIVPGEDNSAIPHDWLAPIATVMRNYCAYFRDSVPLGRIPVCGNPAPHVALMYNSEVPNRVTFATPPSQHAEEPLVRLPAVSSMQCAGVHTSEGLPVEAKQTATVSQTNAAFSDAPADTNQGAYWTATPTVEICGNFDIHRNIALHVAEFHLEQRQRD